jgi:LacI family transcriptional regulator
MLPGWTGKGARMRRDGTDVRVRPVTMRDIARRLGVSRPAVSAALSDRPYTIALSDALRGRIRRAAAGLGYRRNLLARSFILQRSFLVGFLGRAEYFLYAYETLIGVEEALDPAGCSVLSFLHGDTPEDQRRHLQRCVDRRVDGLVVAAVPEGRGGQASRLVADLRAKGIPAVQVYRRLLPRVPVVMVDDTAIGYLATRHLLALGHRRIVHYTYDAYPDRQNPGRDLDARDRHAGYVRAMREAGAKPEVMTFPTARYFPLDAGYAPGAREGASRVAAHPARFTAAVCFSDYVALGLLRGLREAGLRVPQDFSVVGYDDIDLARASDPPLTTVAPPLRQIGREAARRVLDLIAGRPAKDLLFEPALRERGTTAPPAARR